MVDFAGLILAGGEGTRWGGPKAAATLSDGRTFLQSCRDVLQAAGAQPIVATLPPGTDDPSLAGLSIRVLPARGLDMFASLKVGLNSLTEFKDWRAVAILPVDHPLIDSQTVIALSHATVKAAVPSYNGKHGHPVCVGRSIAEAIVKGSLTGPTLREVLRSVDAIDVAVNDPGVVSNCNTPQALAKALEAIRHRSIDS
jgi:CTP:molybdopterin cytidylyltransferase MocA